MPGHCNFSYERERNTQLAKKKEVSALMDDEVPMYLIVLFWGACLSSETGCNLIVLDDIFYHRQLFKLFKQISSSMRKSQVTPREWTLQCVSHTNYGFMKNWGHFAFTFYRYSENLLWLAKKHFGGVYVRQVIDLYHSAAIIKSPENKKLCFCPSSLILDEVGRAKSFLSALRDKVELYHFYRCRRVNPKFSRNHRIEDQHRHKIHWFP